MNKKYELTDEIKEFSGHNLHRIKALIDIPDRVLAGELGGWIESEENLSHEGLCWVADNACVFEDASVRDNAQLKDNAWVCQHAQVYGTANVFGKAAVYENAQVCGNAWVYDCARVCGKSYVCGEACVREFAKLVDGVVRSEHDMIFLGPVGDMGRITLNKNTGTVCNSWHHGFIDEFKKFADEREDSYKYRNEYHVVFTMLKSLLDTQNELFYATGPYLA